MGKYSIFFLKLFHVENIFEKEINEKKISTLHSTVVSFYCNNIIVLTYNNVKIEYLH